MNDEETNKSTVDELRNALMIMAHQLQGPLAAVIGVLSSLKRESLDDTVQEGLNDAQLLVEDALRLSYGIYVSFASELGQTPVVTAETIEILSEVKSIWNHLQRSNSRSDLSVVYRQSADSQFLQMDKNIFTSVVYSLMHNTMKYADEHSQVICEIFFDRRNSETVLKIESLGEPILPTETELIFQKFYRGQAMKYGRHYSGVGLGLWVARSLMHVIGGDISLEVSANQTRLSVFKVHIPN